MLNILSRALATLTGNPILPRWIQDITGGYTEEGVYHAMAADGTTAAAATRGSERSSTGIVVAIHDTTMESLRESHKPRPQTNPPQ